MFRRKDDGTDAIDASTETSSQEANAMNTPTTPAQAAPAAATPAPAAPSAPAPLVASTPVAQPAPSFRPAAPQAAMAAPRPMAAPPVAPAAAPAAPAMPAATADPGSDRVMPAAPVNRQASKRILTVGPDIQMKGEVTSCDRVIIEGTVDATMRDVHTVELTETGSLKGTAEVEDAEISGSFEGDLVVRGRLTIYASGRVRGNVTYGEIEIQRGGQISGNIRNAAEAKAADQLSKKAA